MKKIISIICATVVLLSLAGCSKKDPLSDDGCNTPPTASGGENPIESANSIASIADDDVARKNFSEIRESFDSDVEAIKSKVYDNLNFDKAIFAPPPEVDSISELKLVKLSGKSVDEIYDFFGDAVDELTDNKYSDEEKRREIRFGDGERDERKSPPYDFPNIDEYKNGQETDDPWPLLDDKNYFIWLGGGVILKYNNGDLLDYEGVDRANAHLEGDYTMMSHRHVLYTEDLTSTETYRLVDGELSIADAAKFAQNYIDELAYTPYVDANLPKPIIYAVNVFDIGNGNYGYDFLITYEYNGVRFDRYEVIKGRSRGWTCVQTDYDKRIYGSWMGCIDMIRTDKIHCFADISMQYDVVENEPVTDIIPLNSAADIISDFYSGSMKFNVKEVSMVWLHTNVYGAAKQEAYPCWKFKMQANGEIYHTFVDVITGEVHLYIQAV